jgi:hypothetical protein
VGSLRNPVGPLPSTIYWRRRAVLASVVALLALLAVWVVTSTGGSGSTDAKGPGQGPGSTGSIGPGPSPSGSAITQYPGGRDEPGGSGSGGSSGTGGSGGSGGQGGTDSGTGAGTDAGTTAGAGKNAPGVVAWRIESAKNDYELTDLPRLSLVAVNNSVSTCKMDLGPRNAVVTITRAGADKPLWNSSDCPAGSGTLFYRVPAKSSVTHTLEWNRKGSDATRCGAPPTGAAAPGTYIVEAKAPGMKDLTLSFRLEKD